MPNKLYFLAILTICLSCADDVENNNRIAVQVRVIDENQQPLANIDVLVGGSDNEDFLPQNRFFYPTSGSFFNEVLGYNTTDVTGEVRVISLRPKPRNTLGVTINPEDAQNDLSTVVVGFDTIPDADINIADIQLVPTANVLVQFDRDAAQMDTLSYIIEYQPKIRLLDYPDVSTINLARIRDQLTASSIDTSINIETLVNTTAVLSYRLYNQENEIRGSVEIPITQSNETYEFSY